VSDNIIQTSFAAGELSPSLFARVDFAKYHSGAARMRNFFVDYRSGASTRPGTEFIRPTKQNSGPVRLVRFQQDVDTTYVLEFGDKYLRFISQGDSIVEPPFSITSIVQSTSTTITAPGHNFHAGDLIFVSGAMGMPEINGRYFTVGVITGASFPMFNSLTGQPVNSTMWGAYSSGGTAQRVYTITTSYAAADLALLKFSQKTNVMNITHNNYAPGVLTLINATNWVLAPVTIGATVVSPASITIAASATGTANLLYTVTAVDAQGQEAPVASFGVANGVLDLRTTSGTIEIDWTASAGATAYNVYKSSPSFIGAVSTGAPLGFIGSSSSLVFLDSNINPDFSQTPPIHENPFVSEHPGVSAYFQQRLTYANGGGNDKDRFWMSKPGTDNNFDISNPTVDDDAIDARLVSLEVNEIKSMIPMPSGLIMLTTHGAWQVSGGAGGVATQGGPVTPSTLTATPQAYIGANDVPPILINYDIVFVQQKGSIIRDLSYNIYANIYTGNDISILSSHFFYGHTILEWAYAEEPFKIVWAVRDDGVLLSLTILKEQDMYGWARHDTLGNFKSICTVTEGTLDATYVVVDRPLPNGTVVKQIERLADRTFEFGVEDAWCVDAGVKTPSNMLMANLTISAPTGDVTIKADAPIFTTTMSGWVLRAGSGIIQITAFQDTQTLVGTVTQTITDIIPNDPLGRPNVAVMGEWSIDKPFTKIFGLDHLDGYTVAVLADGGVVPGLIVQNGAITLPNQATKVIAGLGFQAQLQTMYLDLGQEANTVQGKRKKVSALSVRVKDSRGIKAGRTFDHLVPIKELNKVTTAMGQPIGLITRDERIIMDPLWDVPGQICLQIDDPVPATVLGVIPEVTMGDTSK
jgi:hypothetical protein